MDAEAFQQRAISVIKPLIPPDAEERVVRSYKQWNQIVREHIRSETGLKLAEGDSRFSIPVRVVEGFTDRLAQLIGQRDDQVLWRLIVGQPKLGAIVDGLSFLLEDWQAFDQWPALPSIAKGGDAALDLAREIAVALQQAALAKEVRQQITQIHEDILGVYRIVSIAGSSIELYWMPIAMVAAMLNVRIEDLTLVVLAHELSHGYTHIGRDIDGIRWSDAAFMNSALEVIEGLAQFYTQAIMEKIAGRTPGAKTAYEKLLELQSGPYLVHQQWLKDDQRQRGETIRFAMITARSRGPVKHEEWMSLLGETTARLRTRTAQHKAVDPLFGTDGKES